MTRLNARLTEQEIKDINSKCPYEQGIFLQPYKLPEDIKELVVYRRYNTGGVSGGSCWDDSNPLPYDAEPPEDWKVFDLLYELVKPDVTYIQHRKVEASIKKYSDSEWAYYGNYDKYEVEYIPLSKIYEILGV